ncbi:MAG TPA: hypothetical protein VE288_13430 [Rubrobacteraceae bacterium]|nr:hypothetical protein [Rubrobacteraceae bacterium]
MSGASFGSTALIDYPDLIRQATAFSTLVLAINLSLPMVVWMRFRRLTGSCYMLATPLGTRQGSPRGAWGRRLAGEGASA